MAAMKSESRCTVPHAPATPFCVKKVAKPPVTKLPLPLDAVAEALADELVCVVLWVVLCVEVVCTEEEDVVVCEDEVCVVSGAAVVDAAACVEDATWVVETATAVVESSSSSSHSSQSSQSSSSSSPEAVAEATAAVEVTVVVVASSSQSASSSAGVVTVEVGSAMTADEEAAADGVQLAGRSLRLWSFCCDEIRICKLEFHNGELTRTRSGWQHSSKNALPCWNWQPRAR